MMSFLRIRLRPFWNRCRIEMATYESDKLVELVSTLCGRYKRPISSKDVLHYFRDSPDSRPLLLQRPGQLLFKLSRPKRRLPPRIHRVGIVANLAFYAPSKDPEWRVAFAAYSDAYRLKEQIHFEMPEHAVRLIGTRFESFAKNALAGFVQEFEPITNRCQNHYPEVAENFSALLSLARHHAAAHFRSVAPANLISRAAAGRILKQQYALRMPMTDPDSMNVGRHLVHLRWPQYSLFGIMTELFWESQVLAYCRSRWPVNQGERALGRGLSLAMRYGQGVDASSSSALTTSEGSGTLM